MFVRFTRGSAAQVEGSGLGLALIAQQAALHGGTAGLSESPLGGTRLRLRLPQPPHVQLARACLLITDAVIESGPRHQATQSPDRRSVAGTDDRRRSSCKVTRTRQADSRMVAGTSQPAEGRRHSWWLLV
ncbi:ATP-binding protein [Rhodococcus sp. OK302]|uniref:ATP-binding protein n=1 Tax=Rhodococcus sp. OK302 TaxID=1882769 RepID=UPI001595FBD4